MSSIDQEINPLAVNWNQLKGMGKELIDALPTLNADERDNGLKCFQLGYLSLVAAPHEMMQAPLLLNIISRECMNYEVSEILEHRYSFGVDLND